MPIKPKDYFDKRKCCICGTNKTTMGYGSPRWHRCHCKKVNCSKYLCHKCYGKIEVRLPDSHCNLIKAMRQCRTTGFNFGRDMCKGCIGVEIVAKTLGLKNLNIVSNNFNSNSDISVHPEYGRIEVKTSTLNKFWQFDIKNKQIIENKFDTIFLLCMDHNIPWKNILRVYAIPFKEIVKHGFHIYITPTTISWLDKFEVDKKIFNDIYTVLGLLCPYKKKLSEDISN